MSKAVLGLSSFYHDSAASVARDGVVLAAAQEERFSRIKHDASFPDRAIAACMRTARVDWPDIGAIVFYDKPLLKFERLIETFVDCAPNGLKRFLQAGPIWAKDKLFQKKLIRTAIHERFGIEPKSQAPIYFTEHHHAHAASAFFPSPFERAAVLCLDGVGEWATTSAWVGAGSDLKPLWRIDFPHSLGLFYSAFTYYCGFRVNSGEYKLMGLAPFGRPVYVDRIREELIDVKSDGSFRLNLEYFEFLTGDVMTNRRFASLFDGEPRRPETELRQRDADIAASAQWVTEDIIIRLADTVRRETGETNLCIAGGVALNCVANGKLSRKGVFDALWIQPAAGDAGGALGAALAFDTQRQGSPRKRVEPSRDAMSAAALGPNIETDAARSTLVEAGAVFEEISENRALVDRVASRLASGAIVGWVQGRMEFGPRALGRRSILADPRSKTMRSDLNRRIKFREGFRPFAPVVPSEDVSRFFELDGESPYMTLVARTRDAQVPEFQSDRFLERLAATESALPAVTHVDGTARIQTVRREDDPLFTELLRAFERLTGIPILVNTSFNVRGEPIVADAADAFRCFMRSHMDALAVGPFWLEKSKQTEPVDVESWRATFPLD